MSEKALELIREAKRTKEQILLLHGLGLKELPKEISELVHLERLYLEDNQLTDISPLSGLANLSRLHLNDNQLADISPLSKLTNLSELSLNSNRLTDISPLSDLVNLSILHLNYNQLTDILPLSKLMNLSQLSLDDNQLTDISSLSNLVKLSELFLSQNQLTDISPLSNLVNLSRLNLFDNQLTDVSTLSNCTKLSKLFLHKNQLTDVSPLSNLTNLSELSLSENRLSAVSSLSGLLNLKNLHLAFNQLSDISPLRELIEKIGVEWTNNRSRGTISIAEAPLKIPPPEIVRQGKEAVLQYLEATEQDASRFYEAKLLILGEGGVGKTTLYRKLQDGNADMPEAEDTTKGIEIHQLPFKMQGGEHYFTINLWDFGGQEIYHATHQFFLSKRSLYVLVSDTRKEDTDFNYWLQVIELLGGDSPVIIVQNEKGGRKKQIDINSMRVRFSNIKEMVSLDLKHDIEGIEKLYQTIQHHIQNLPHIGDVQPQNWINIRRKLEELSPDSPYIDIESYYRICKENEIKKRDEMLKLSQYLHDLGVLLHFQDDAILRRMLILQKEWATDAVYTVLDNAKVIDNQGKFSREDAEQIWGSKYEGNDEELLRLMMKFELCYQVPDVQPQEYIATQLLRIGKPDYAWKDSRNLRLEYRYAFMPKGLTSRFIVRMQRYIRDESKIWRKGVVLYRGNTRAEVAEVYGTDTLKIRVEGQEQKEFITIITEELDRLNDTFGGELRVEKMVPCNCRTCENRAKPNFYAYKEDLMRRKERGKRTVECKISYDDVDVAALLDAVFVSGGMQATQKKLFISYSKADDSYLEAFKIHLSPLIRNNDLITWDDKNVIPGEEWDERIIRELNEADIIVFLVSANFLATEYIVGKEIKTAIQRHERGEARVIPVIIRDCAWKEMEFSKLSALPQKGKSVKSYKEDMDLAWLEVVEAIKSVLDLNKGG